MSHPEQPNISYTPDREKWTERTKRRLQENPQLLLTPLPIGFPAKIASPLVWEGSDWKNEAQWVFNLTSSHLEEIRFAVDQFRTSGLSFGHINPESFPLPVLGKELKELAHELYDGRGFFVLRGVPVNPSAAEDNVLIFAGLASYIAEKRALQDANGGVLSHIKDLSSTLPKGAIGGPAYTTVKQVFHTDLGCDVVALFALQTAAEGGTSRISSAARVYNELAATRPDLVNTLVEPWPFDRFGANPPYRERPLIYNLDNRLILQYARRYFTGYGGLPRSSAIPAITEAQAEALDALHFLGEKFSLGLNFMKGDIQFINNLSIFHARDGFKDSPEQTRHLLRLWLRNEELAWKLPEELKPVWAERFSVDPKDQTFAIEPVVRNEVRGKRSARNE